MASLDVGSLVVKSLAAGSLEAGPLEVGSLEAGSLEVSGGGFLCERSPCGRVGCQGPRSLMRKPL